jgi:hypothetical protein
MSSAHRIDLIKDLTLVDKDGDGNGWAVGHPDLVDENGNSLGEVRLTGSQAQHVAYSKTVALSPKYNDYILTATCTGCVLTVEFEMSPDGVNWCACNLSNGSPCEFTCTATVGDCTISVIDVPVLQFVRVKISNAGDASLDCSIFLTHTMNY